MGWARPPSRSASPALPGNAASEPSCWTSTRRATPPRCWTRPRCASPPPTYSPTRAPRLLSHAISPSSWGPTIGVVAADSLLERHNALAGRDATLRLRIALTGVNTWDIVLIDSPPSLAGLTRNALVASHFALIVAEPSLFALQGAQAALEAVELVRADNLRLRPAGIVVNKLRTQSTEHRFRWDELRSTYGDLVLDPPLPDRTAVQQAEGACVPVQAWRSPGARDVADALEDLFDHVMALPSTTGPLLGRAPGLPR